MACDWSVPPEVGPVTFSGVKALRADANDTVSTQGEIAHNTHRGSARA